MRLDIRKALALALLLLFSASLALADQDKVLKVYILKSKKTGRESGLGPSFNFENVELTAPTDDELSMAKKAIEAAGFNPEDLKIEEAFPLEMVILQVKKAYPDQPVTEGDKVNGIPVVRPTEEELDQQKMGFNVYKQVKEFLNNLEFQFGGGGAPTLSDGLSHSYHTGNYFFGGLGYQFTRNFDMLMNLEFGQFISGNDSRTGGFEMDELTLELLAKYRITSKGLRPYLFAGPAVTQSTFGASFTYQSFNGNVSYVDQSHFTMVGGAGFEIPLGNGHLFIQGEMVYDFLPDDTANFATLDKTIRFIPIELGWVWGR